MLWVAAARGPKIPLYHEKVIRFVYKLERIPIYR